MHKILYETPQKNHHDKPYLMIKENDGYTYAERLGIDSVAFVLYDRRKTHNPYGVRCEYKPPIDSFITGAFGGSLDDNDKTTYEIVQQEVLEEAGFTVDLNRIYYLGKCFVSTQMNQYCRLYIVDVTYLEQGETKLQGKWESKAGQGVSWVTESWLQNNGMTADWKSNMILLYAKQKGII